MKDKQQILALLREELNRWEDVLAGLSNTQISTPHSQSIMSTKDVVGHLRAWQQVSNARLEAALDNSQPVYPDWLQGADPDSDEELDSFNARIYQTYHEQPWSSVYQVWHAGFQRLLELAEATPEQSLFDTEKYPWLNGYALVDVLQGTYEHHQEHRDALLAWLQEQDSKDTTKS